LENKTLYQTLENRDNPDYILENGPFKCTWSNSWVGHGYYFWDTFIENAHWWGVNHNKNKYIIGEAEINFSSSLCFDLVGNTKHMQDFHRSIELMRANGLIKSKTTVARVIHHMKDTLKIFNYGALRIYGINSKSKTSQFDFRLFFEFNKKQYLDYKPAIQICIYNFKDLNFRNWEIVFPDQYNIDYMV